MNGKWSVLSLSSYFLFEDKMFYPLVTQPTFVSVQSHAGKVVLRSWYERNKHIFPASRWEPYDPEKKWEKYTVSTAVEEF